MKAVVASICVLAALPATAAAEELTVQMPGRAFLPPQLTAVVGDTVTWVNSSNENHDVTAEGGPFASGGVGPEGRFSYRADTPGAFAYACAIHRTQMTGQLDVVPVALAGPPAPITVGESALLTGRAPAGSGPVALEEIGADGAARGIDTLTPSADGAFTATVRPSRTTAYRAVGAGGASPALTVPVIDRVKVLVSARRGKQTLRLRVRTDPARPGDTVALQLYSRERFAWRQVKHGTLDAQGRVELTLPRRLRRLARVVLEREGLLVGRSATLMTWKAGPIPPKPGGSAPEPHGEHHGGH